MFKYIVIFIVFSSIFIGLIIADRSYEELRFLKYSDAYDQLYEKGWLPEIVPKSAHNIHAYKSVEASTFITEFDFDISQVDTIIQNLTNAISEEQKKIVYDRISIVDWDISPRKENIEYYYETGKQGIYNKYVAVDHIRKRAWIIVK